MNNHLLLSDKESETQPTQLFQFSRDRERFREQVQNVRKWIDALRSGRYTKNQSNRLRDEEGFSILGIADHVVYPKSIPSILIRLGAFEEFGLSNSVGGCNELYYQDDEDGETEEYNSLLDLPFSLSFLEVANLIEQKLDQQIAAHEVYFRLINTDKDLDLFDKDQVKWNEEQVKQHITTWLEALRSGEYLQTTERLQCLRWPVATERGLDESEPRVIGYCCLGVANVVCDLKESHSDILDMTYAQLGLQSSQGSFDLTDEERKLAEDAGMIRKCMHEGNTCTLTELNDQLSWSFAMIADFVEAQYKIVRDAISRISKETG